MEWTEDAILMAVRSHGETSLIAEVMTRGHGRHMGLVKGGRARSRAATLQPGNLVRVRWYARLDQHLGQFSVDPIELRAGRLMESAVGLYGLTALAAIVRLLPEREPHGALYEALNVILEQIIDEPAAPMAAPDRTLITAALVVRFELAVLEALGFGLDLTSCAATGGTEDLVYVSPKSGRAVCRASGYPYHDRMLALPAFLTTQRNGTPTVDDVLAGFQLTQFFLGRNVYGPRGIDADPARNSLIRALSG